MTESTTKKPSFGEAFRFWLKLGFISFGGPAGQIAIMHQFLVEQKRWISDSRFMHGLNYCMILPGPEAQQLATYIGWLLHGVRGGLVAGILFIFPSIFILLALSITYVLYGKLPWVAALFYGLKPAVIAIVVVALIKICKKSLLSAFHYAVASISFVCIFFLNISFPFVIAGAIIIGFLVQRFFPAVMKTVRGSENVDREERSYFLNKYSDPVTDGLTPASAIKKVAIAVVLWSVPVVLFMLLSTNSDFWLTVTTFFTKAALVTFGGAYAVLPYVAEQSVERFQWLNQYQMIDGLALGETTPGPLIMVLVFVGFMAGYHQSGSLMDGTLGLLTTTFYTFLPSFLFIFLGAPFVERTKENEKLKSVLAIVTAAVVGVVLNLTLYLGQAVVFPAGWESPDWFALTWLVISFVALYKMNANMIAWIAISAAAGLIRFLIL